MKRLIGLCLALFVTACNAPQPHIGETQMSKNLSVTLEENLYSPEVTAIVQLQTTIDYKKAELYINDFLIGEFQNGVLRYKPKEFGDVPCIIKFDDTKAEPDTLKLYIETSFLQYNSSENGDIKQCGEGENVVLTPSNVAFGSSDMIWMYNIRVAQGKEITFDFDSIALNDNNKNFGGAVLDIHFRFDDYKNRYDLYPPDEPYVAKYIDAEPDKWISAPVTLTHGIHNLYVCPSAGADKSYITVYHSGEKNGSFSANYKTITNWPAK